MNLPDFLNDGFSGLPRVSNGTSQVKNGTHLHGYDEVNGRQGSSYNNHGLSSTATTTTNSEDPLHHSKFNEILFRKLSNLNEEPKIDVEDYYPVNGESFKNVFNLPEELQGGVSNISSRRPSYAAESFTRNNFSYHSGLSHRSPHAPVVAATQNSNFVNNNNNNTNRGDLSSLAMINNSHYQSNSAWQRVDADANAHAPFNLNDSFSDLSMGTSSRFSEFQLRRPSQLVDYSFNLPFTSQSSIGGQSSQAYGPTTKFAPFQEKQGGNTSPTLQQSHYSPLPLSLPFQQNNLNTQTQFHQQHSSSGPSMSSGPTGPTGPTGLSRLSGLSGPSVFARPFNNLAEPGQAIKVENGLLVKDQYLVASQELRALFSKITKYFQNPELTAEVISKMNDLLTHPVIIKLITFIKNLNNLTFNHRMLCLVINKNGKFDLLSYPHNSNIFLQKGDLVIVDGDRGKDMVMIVEPLVNLNFAILFNFLRKLEHIKSLTVYDGTKKRAHSSSMNASDIVNSHKENDENEFSITLPTKQVLRFATPKEIHKLSGKFLQEKKAFTTCYNKIRELNMDSGMTLVNVEYQSDFKKLVFYYFAGFCRIDFRILIKELFKIFKTRIWLCAVLPHDRPELYVTTSAGDAPMLPDEAYVGTANESIPKEYELTNDQILKFSITEFANLPQPNYFHSINTLNLIQHVTNEIKGPFYGFNAVYTNENNTETTAGKKD
ncbi:uncharacterized protein LODBEIA_P02060 [Lodderomyces beijingensis]|uniref:PSP1 C-terminal domain-containing protein n=1 Tax=Lodderomyces beijingensis TaxID=1775926 RepID=A0ABP0ZCS7_9ASCO